MKQPVYGGAHSDATTIAEHFGAKVKKSGSNRSQDQPLSYEVMVPELTLKPINVLAILRDLGYTLVRLDTYAEFDGYTETEGTANRCSGQHWVKAYILKFSVEDHWYISFRDKTHKPGDHLSFDRDLTGLEIEDVVAGRIR